MATAETTDLASLYETDETAWLDTMADLARSGQVNRLDLVNLAEFLESMGRRDRREVTRRMTVLLIHLLKWAHQPDRRSASWIRTILNQRRELETLIESATLKNHAAESLSRSYAIAARDAAAETRLPEATFPGLCPFTLDDALSAPIVGDLP